MTSDRSLLLCHLQAGPLTFHRVGQAVCARNLNTGAIHLPRGQPERFFLLSFQGGGEPGQGEAQVLGPLKSGSLF